MRPQWSRWSWPLAAMLLMVTAVEVAGHALRLPPLVGVTLLVMALAVVAYAAIHGGTVVGTVVASMLAAYTLHFVSPHDAWFALRAETVQAGSIMLVIGLVVAGVVGTLKSRSDSVARAALEAERRHAAELEETNRSLNRMNEALEAFTYLVGHDLKEPVRTTEILLGFLETDHAKSLDDDGRDILRRARRANERLASLLASLLDLSRASRVEPRDLAPLSVPDVIESEACRARYQDEAARRGARIEVATDGAPRVLGAVEPVAQVFGNLILNAVKHNPSDAPRVVVRSRGARDGAVGFVVEDDGPGFPDRLLARFRGDDPLPSSTKDGGFGLIIAKRAVLRLGGRIELGRSSELGGASVLVELPEAAPDVTP